MSTPDDIALSPAAPFLFSEEEMSVLEKTELAEGKYTGERLLARRPHVYQLVVKLLGQAWSVNSICEVCGVHAYTVAAVGAREKISIEDHKKVMINGLAFTSRMLIERLMELVPQADSVKDVSVALGINIEKLQLLSGGATARVEGLDGNAPNPFADWLAKAKPVDGRVIDVPSEMGSEAGGDLQKGAADLALREASPTPFTDSQSDVPSATVSDGRQEHTDFPTARPQPDGEQSSQNDQGGRGSDL